MARLLAIAVAFTLGITVAQFIILRLAAPSLVDVSQENEQLQARLQAADAERRQLLQVLDVERQTRTRYEAAAVAMNVSLQRVQGKLQTLAHASNTALEQAVSAQLQAEHTAREMENTALELQRSLYAALQSSSKNGQHGNTASQTKHQLQQLQIRQQGKDTRSLVVPMLGDWEEASDDDWYSLLRRRGCRDRGFREKVQVLSLKKKPKNVLVKQDFFVFFVAVLRTSAVAKLHQSSASTKISQQLQTSYVQAGTAAEWWNHNIHRRLNICPDI
eukprot:m.2368 g.2368  ORF g.2368 m.2368 type:complete len:274 (+) comp1541_c0_seq2:10-831(+)